jgi:SAM-dependent methyltransferase
MAEGSTRPGPTVAIVTAVYGGYDRPRPQVEQDVEVDWIYFTADGDQEVPEPFRRIEVPPLSPGAEDRSVSALLNLSAKRFKMTPWKFLDHDLIIWIDANMEILSRGFAREALSSMRDGAAFFLHPRRDCVYQEAEALLGLESQGGKFADQPIAEQIDHYRIEGFPRAAGLWASGVIAWDPLEPKARRLGSEWFAEVNRWSIRDQLSLPVVARRVAVVPGIFPLPQLEVSSNPEFLGNRWLRIWPHGHPATRDDAAAKRLKRQGSASRSIASLPTMIKPSAGQGSSAARDDFYEIDLESDSVHADVVQLVDREARVLELGPATGYMSRAFAGRGCTVIGIELDPEKAARAEEFCERVIVGDLDSVDLDQELGEERFDAIVAADVLGHLRDPLKAVEKLKAFLKEDGYFVISVPNVAHGSIRLSLLGGNFEYQESGLLDSTHLHFFTRDSLEELLDKADLGLALMHRHELNLDASEVPFDPGLISAPLRDQLEKDPDARTYQFVVKALPMPADGLQEIQARLRELPQLHEHLEELRECKEEAEGRVAELEGVLAEIGGREGELRRALIDAHDQLLRRDAELDAMRKGAVNHEKDLENVRAELDRVNGELVAALAGLQRIRSSAPYRVLAALKSTLRPGASGP